MTPRRLLPLIALTPLLLLGTAGPALADTGAAAAALRSSQLYEDPSLDLVDKAALTQELQGSQPKVYVAVLPASDASSAADARADALTIGKALGVSDDVVLVITANKHLGVGEGNAASQQGVNAAAALAATPHGSFDKDGLTAFVTDFTERIKNQAAGGGSSGSTSDGNGSATTDSGGSSHTGAYLLGGLVVLGGGGVLLARRSSRKRLDRENAASRAEVTQLYDRLGADVSNLDAAGKPVAQQALADAAERYNACGAGLASASSEAEFAAARRSAVEGLTAARTARKELGLDLGPEIPLAPGSGPQLNAQQQVAFGDQQYDGSPNYRPGYQHYYGGGMLNGQMVPGGWYPQPFWTPFLLGSMLGGGFGGGGLFGGGYGYGGGGYGAGYEEGREDARDDGGGGGGGDWGGGGGGGDWGGGGGGGDWGGGGGGGGGGDW